LLKLDRRIDSHSNVWLAVLILTVEESNVAASLFNFIITFFSVKPSTANCPWSANAVD